MEDTTNLDERTPAASADGHDGGVTLINSFVVPAGREDAFQELWTEASNYFRAQPGYVALRLHRALTPDARYRFVNVARWATASQFYAAHDTDEFRRVVGQPAWREFPSNPTLYEVIVEHDAPTPARV